MGFHEAIFDTLNDWSIRYLDDGLPEEFGFSSDDDLVRAGEKLRANSTVGRRARFERAEAEVKVAGAAERLEFPEEVLAPLSKFPDVIAAALFNVARAGFKNKRRMRWVWKPGYDFEINVSQERGGSVTVVVTTPYPDEMRDFAP